MPLGHLLTLRIDAPVALAPTRPLRLALARRVARVGLPFELLTWRAEGPQARVVVLGPPEAARACAQRLLVALHALPATGAWVRPHLEPLRDAAALGATVRAVLRARPAEDPDHEASALPELLGLRADPAGLRDRLRRHLPGLPEAELLACLGRHPWALPPGRAPHLAAAAAAAVSEVELQGPAPHRVLARAAAAQVALPVLGPEAVAAALGLPLRAVPRLLGLPVPPSLRRAVEGQWRLVTASAAGAAPPVRRPAPAALVQ